MDIEYIRKSRIELGITQKQASELLNISYIMYGSIERGVRGVSVELLVDIIKLLKLDPVKLLKL